MTVQIAVINVETDQEETLTFPNDAQVIEDLETFNLGKTLDEVNELIVRALQDEQLLVKVLTSILVKRQSREEA